MIKTIKEYVQIYPLEQFPLLKEFYTNLHSYSRKKNILWEPFIKDSLKHGLKVICRILEKRDNGEQTYDAYVSMIGGPEYDLFYLGFSYKKSEEDIIKMLEEYSDSIFSIEDWDKESMQKFFIETLLKGDIEYLEYKR
ncbi:hypothetical protein [Butyrivibrio sp.]|uniref:hypothetical protein n=1 Tax=Butyrivibrio sp. TaxID=28121 RepID=UPI0025C52335|nr:hypothetical protein [Butyrivibrio sp.]MBQ9302742.1 hypothetical protein [Butyrivibrio sp.]